jgi:hypothetical protein
MNIRRGSSPSSTCLSLSWWRSKPRFTSQLRESSKKVKRGITFFYLPLIIMVVLYTKIYITARGIIEKVKRRNIFFYLPVIKE